MPNLPLYISIIFALTTIVAVIIFYKAAKKSKLTLIVLGLWLLIQAILGISGFYTVTDTIPPRFVLMVAPPLLVTILLFLTAKGRNYIDNLDLSQLTLLHCLRIPVEMVLMWLCVYKMVPELMTFEGRNFDILSGLSASFIYYYGFIQKKLSNKVLLIWNFICLALLFNIVIHAVLSAPSPLQRLAFDQPNIGVLYFPFNWLPGCVVPLVLLSHLAAIRQLILKK